LLKISKKLVSVSLESLAPKFLFQSDIFKTEKETRQLGEKSKAVTFFLSLFSLFFYFDHYINKATFYCHIWCGNRKCVLSIIAILGVEGMRIQHRIHVSYKTFPLDKYLEDA